MKEFSKSSGDTQKSGLCRFGGFQLDLRTRSLRHAGKIVPLTPKALETLSVLVRHRGEIVEKDVLLELVWPETYVEESTLSQNILTLRKKLGSIEPGISFIETVPRRGYRWAAPTDWVREDLPGAIGGFVPARQITIALTVAVILILGITAAALLSPGRLSDTAFKRISVTTVFSDADLQNVAVSPNGKYLAVAISRDGVQSIHLRHSEESNTLEVVPSVSGRLLGMEFSAAGDYLYFSATDADLNGGRLLRVPLLGGAIQTVAIGIDSPPSLSRDGRSVAFVRNDRGAKSSTLILADSDGRNERSVAARPLASGFQTVALSPDAGTVAAVVRVPERGTMEFAVVDVTGGRSVSLPIKPFRWIGQAAWLRDGSGIVFISYPSDSPNLTDEVWVAARDGSGARMIGNGVSGAFGLSLSGDAAAMYSVRANKITNLSVVSINDPSRALQLITKTGDESLLPLGMDWSADGTILYATTQNGNADVWTMRDNGSGRRQITADRSAEYFPVAGGEELFFLSNRDGAGAIWRMGRDGSAQTKLAIDGEIASLTRDASGTLYFTVFSEGIFRHKLFRLSDGDTAAVKLSERFTYSPRVSDDGRLIACYTAEGEAGRLALALLGGPNGEFLRTLATPESDNLPLFDWFPDGRSLLLATGRRRASTLWKLDIESGKSEKIAEWPDESVFRIAVSPDGQSVLVEKGVTANEIVKISDEG